MLIMSEDPVAILRNLYEVSTEGCILGVTIWGDKEKNNFLRLFDDAVEALGGPPNPEKHAMFGMYNKL